MQGGAQCGGGVVQQGPAGVDAAGHQGEVVDHPRVDAGVDGHAGVRQAGGVGLALVAVTVELGIRDERRGQPGQVGGPQRRDVGVLRGLGAREVLHVQGVPLVLPRQPRPVGEGVPRPRLQRQVRDRVEQQLEGEAGSALVAGALRGDGGEVAADAVAAHGQPRGVDVEQGLLVPVLGLLGHPAQHVEDLVGLGRVARLGGQRVVDGDHDRPGVVGDSAQGDVVAGQAALLETAAVGVDERGQRPGLRPVHPYRHRPGGGVDPVVRDRLHRLDSARQSRRPGEDVVERGPLGGHLGGQASAARGPDGHLQRLLVHAAVDRLTGDEVGEPRSPLLGGDAGVLRFRHRSSCALRPAFRRDLFGTAPAASNAFAACCLRLARPRRGRRGGRVATTATPTSRCAVARATAATADGSAPAASSRPASTRYRTRVPVSVRRARGSARCPGRRSPGPGR